jgi:hypothetical protein
MLTVVKWQDGHQYGIEKVWFCCGRSPGIWRFSPGGIALDTLRQGATAEGMAVQGRVGRAPTGPLMRLYGGRNDKPPFGGLTLPGEWHYACFANWRTSSLVLLMDLSTYLYASAHLVGETTRRQGLNLDRGSQPLDTQRIAGKREWHRETGKCSPQRMAPSVITPHDPR